MLVSNTPTLINQAPAVDLLAGIELKKVVYEFDIVFGGFLFLA
jgi:hypothetical protein